jgi:hypothetical protein
VLALLRRPRTLKLLVSEHGQRERLPGAVALGRRPEGAVADSLDLRVRGRRLRAGSYTTELVALFGAAGTSDSPGVAFRLTRGGRVRALSARCSVPAAVRNGC